MRHAPYLTNLAAAAALSATVAAQLPSCFNTDQGTPINAGDETISAALPLGFTFTWPDGTTSSDAVVTSNGRISASSAGLAPDFAVGVAEFLAGAPTIAAVWADLDFASTAGDIEFFADPQGQFAVFTFRDAVEFAGLNQFTFQVQLNADNSFALRYDDRVAAGIAVTAAVLGSSAGPGTPDPGASDFSSTIGAAPIDSMTNGTVYEDLTTAGTIFDLNNIELQFLPNGSGGYLVVASQCPRHLMDPFFVIFLPYLCLT